jgi:hypothetical protein
MYNHKNFVLIITFTIFFSLFILISCGKKSTTPEETDQSVILDLITAYPDIFRTCVIDTSRDSSGFGKVSGGDEDTVKFWWRRIFWGQTKRSIDIDVHPVDLDHPYPYANVTITDTLTGELHLIKKSGQGNWSWDDKPITDIATRSAYFEKRRPVDSAYRGWDIIKVSGLLVRSVPTTREIDSLHIKSTLSGYDTTIIESDIAQCILIENLFTFGEEDSITVTVYSGDPTDSVYLHAYFRPFPYHFHVRRSFINNGDGSFSGTWVTADLPLGASPYRHTAIDVIKHSTLDNDDAYDSRIWGVIYRVMSITTP